MIDSNTRPAAIYIRVSSAGQEQDGTSLDTQLERCRAYAAASGLTVEENHIYREVHTGTELWERPKLTALREAVRRREVSTVIAYAIDRLSRDPVHLGVIISEAEHAGAAVQFVTEPLDESPEGQLIRFVRGYAAKVEHEKFKERSWRGKVARARSGRPLVGACPPFGYQWLTTSQGGRLVKTTLGLDPERAPIVRALFEDAAAGASLWALARNLTARGIPTAKGRGGWRVSTLGAILHNPIYTGTVAAFRHSANPHDGVITTEDGVPAIVSRELFDGVAARFTRNKALASRNHHDPEATLLRGCYAVCGHCGTTMYAQKHSPRTGYIYRCPAQQYDATRCQTASSSVRATIVCWVQRVAATLRDPSVIAAKLAELRQHDPTASDVAAVERRMAGVERRRSNLVDAIADADQPVVRAALAEKLAALTEESDGLGRERQALHDRQAAWQAIDASYANLEAWRATVADRLEQADYAMKRLALDYLGVRVRVFRPGSPERYVVEAVRITPNGEIVSTISAGYGCAGSPPPRQTAW